MAATPKIEGSPSRTDATLVGRTQELATFSSAFDRMLAGRRQILTVAGEPGIGKTRLSEALTETAEGQGALVLWGRCYEEPGAPPYWPWVQILREFIAASSPSELMRLVGDSASRLEPLVPEIAEILGASSAEKEVPLQPGQTRFSTFDAIGRFLRRATDEGPLVLIIDNVHWADTASLALLEFLSQELSRSRILIVCTYRDTEISRRNRLTETLGELSRSTGIERLKLGGLGKKAIAALAGQMLSEALPKSVIAMIDHQTDGNPLFVIELLKVLLEESNDAGIEPIAVRIPDGVRETIGRRLSRLPDDVNELLRIASVIGRSFEVRQLAHVARLDVQAVLESLHLARIAGFVEMPDEQANAYRFTHALIRETLYDEIPTPDRLRLHGLAGDALIAIDPDRLQQRLSQIAHHYFESAALAHAEKAADYAMRAGQEALRVTAYEEAVTQFSNVLRLARDHGVGDADVVRRATYLKARAILGRGDTAGCTALLVDLIGDCDSLEKARQLVDIVGLWSFVKTDSMQAEQLPVLRRILELLPERDNAERAQVLVAQAFAERSLGSRARICSLVDESIAMARRVGDREVLHYCLRTGFYALNGDPATLDLRLRLTGESVRTAPKSDLHYTLAEAMYQQSLNFFEAGRIDELERLLTEYEQLHTSSMGLHEQRAKTHRVMLALLRGEYAGLEKEIEAVRENGSKTRMQDADGVFGSQMFALIRDLGKLHEVAPVIERFATLPGSRAWTPGLMLALVEVGKLDAAKLEFEKLAADGFAQIPADDLRATCLVYCAEVCSAVGDQRRAQELYTLLLPYAGTFATHPTAVCFGSADLFLGMLSATCGEFDAARQHFEAAIKANSAARAWPWVARSYYQYARALVRSNVPDDISRSQRFLREAEQIAGRIGMEGLASEIGVALRGPGANRAWPDGLTAREVDVLRLIVIGRSNKDISKVLSISLNTVATHVRNILAKTDCANRTEAAAYAGRHNLNERSD